MVEYRAAVRAYNAAMVDDKPSEDIGRLRTSFYECVSLLRHLNAEGKVENVEGLPDPADIMDFDMGGLRELQLDLRRRYFPNKEDLNQPIPPAEKQANWFDYLMYRLSRWVPQIC